MADPRPARLTTARRQVLELAQAEGAVDRRDVARALFRGNVRTAAKALKDLHALGLLGPVRICEYRLSEAGRAWLDDYRQIRDAGGQAGERGSAKKARG